MKSGKQIIILLIALAVVAAALAWSFHRVGTEGLAQAVRNIDWKWAPVAVLAQLLVFRAKAWRWRVILGKPQGVRYSTLLSAIMIGFMANSIFSRIGELVRAVVMSIRKEMKTSSALASIALERIFDTCIVVLFLVIALFWLNPATSGEAGQRVMQLRVTGLVAGAGFVVVCVFLVLLRLRPEPTSKFILWFFGWLPEKIRGHVERFMQTFLDGLQTVRSFRQLAWILALSVFHWMLQVLFFYFAGLCLPSLGMTLPIAMLVFVVTAFGVAGLPLPGYLGIYQAAVLLAGLIAGATADQMTSGVWFHYSWVSWLLNIPFVIIAGFIFLWAGGLSLKQIQAETTKGAQDSAKG